ncbi:uncharacterized protein [Physcomitrium patens]|uniref:uncharacterized protein isoform X1 n=1 Tax=Physcomitrium patens TaxID=3218 RepID=UPI003CCD8FE4
MKFLVTLRRMKIQLQPPNWKSDHRSDQAVSTSRGAESRTGGSVVVGQVVMPPSPPTDEEIEQVRFQAVYESVVFSRQTCTGSSSPDCFGVLEQNNNFVHERHFSSLRRLCSVVS